MAPVPTASRSDRASTTCACRCPDTRRAAASSSRADQSPAVARRTALGRRFVMRPRALLVSIPAFALALTVVIAPNGRAADPGHAHHTVPMTDADMRKWVDDYYATHPRVGVNRVGVAAAATVTVVSFRFEADGNPATQIDTVKIAVGES